MSYVVRYVRPSDIIAGGRISPTTFHPKVKEDNGISAWSFDYYQRMNPNDPIGELRRNHGRIQFNPNGKLILIGVNCLYLFGLEVIEFPTTNNPAHVRIQTFPTNPLQLDDLSINLLNCIEEHYSAG